MIYAIGERYRPSFEKSLNTLDIETIWLPDNPLFDKRLSGHADLNLIAGNNTIIISKGLDDSIVNYLTNKGVQIRFVSKQESNYYPDDVGLCASDTGKYLICNPDTVDNSVLELYSDRHLVPVSQGYTHCCCCVVNEESIITSDAGISKAAKKFAIDVLDIQNGFIELQGFNEGFIGGATFRFNNKIIFSGNLDSHPDKTKILDFLRNKGLEPLFLTKRPIFDFGGAIALP